MPMSMPMSMPMITHPALCLGFLFRFVGDEYAFLVDFRGMMIRMNKPIRCVLSCHAMLWDGMGWDVGTKMGGGITEVWPVAKAAWIEGC